MSIGSNGLGSRIRHRRQELGMKQIELANACGLSRGYICNLERGYDIHPSISTLQRVADTLALPFADVAAWAAGNPAMEADGRNADERRILAIFHALNPEDQALVERVSVSLLSSERSRGVVP